MRPNQHPWENLKEAMTTIALVALELLLVWGAVQLFRWFNP